MPKRGISVTLEDTNLLWLKSRTLARKGRSLSETLDDLVTTVRTSGAAPAGSVRSVAGTADIASDDPNLDQADAYLRGLVDSSLAMPFLARESPPPFTTGRRPKGRRRG